MAAQAFDDRHELGADLEVLADNPWKIGSIGMAEPILFETATPGATGAVRPGIDHDRVMAQIAEARAGFRLRYAAQIGHGLHAGNCSTVPRR
jgi:hypothetical protein